MERIGIWAGGCMAPALLFFLAAGAAWGEDPWADSVAGYAAIDPVPGFDTPGKALGEPVGGGTFAAGNTSLHSVGAPGAAPGSYIILKFDTPVTDDPANPLGLDCIVYGNAFWVGGDPGRKLAEAGLISISADVNGNGLPDDAWYVIPGSRGLGANVMPGGIPNPTPPLAGTVENPNSDGTEHDWGYADLSPTQRKYLDNYVRPDDPLAEGLSARSGGGDAFDIAWAVDGAGQPAGLSQFDFLRISAFIDGSNGPFGSFSPEIDGAADVAPDVDADGDGILDEYETRVAGTDPARPESTVLALEIPPEDGGSPAGASLGAAADGAGNALALFSGGARSGVRDYNCMVDILPAADPAPGALVPGLTKSGAVRDFQASVSDFEAAQVQHAKLTIAYSAGEITGLDEPGLTPYRYDGAGYTQAGISSVAKDPENNRVTFRSQFPGVFVLASGPGSGDGGAGGGAIVLEADPGVAQAGNPGELVTITSEVITDGGGTPAADNTLFTVDTTLGSIVSADADAGEPGVQAASLGGVIQFQVRTGTTAGTASISALSLDGLIQGELELMVSAGAAQGPVEIFLLDPNAAAPGPVEFTTSVITDAWDNPLDAGAYVTLVTGGGFPTAADAQPGVAGHQLALTSGVANFAVRVTSGEGHDTAMLDVLLYADAGQGSLLGQETYILEVVQLPLAAAGPCAALLAVFGAMGAWRRRRR